ncbi:Uncharacterised protein [Mycobacterium tuberculosis]|nr:Uncharacterised protein [Mycobacterium tuberculosis]
MMVAMEESCNCGSPDFASAKVCSNVNPWVQSTHTACPMLTIVESPPFGQEMPFFVRACR